MKKLIHTLTVVILGLLLGLPVFAFGDNRDLEMRLRSGADSARHVEPAKPELSREEKVRLEFQERAYQERIKSDNSSRDHYRSAAHECKHRDHKHESCSLEHS
jgi:hypothetical protein